MIKSNCMKIKLLDPLWKTNNSHSGKQTSNVSLPYMDAKDHAQPNRCTDSAHQRRCMCKVISIKFWAVRINERVIVLALGLMETINGYTCFNQPHFTMNLLIKLL